MGRATLAASREPKTIQAQYPCGVARVRQGVGLCCAGGASLSAGDCNCEVLMDTYLEILEMIRQEHAELAFDGEIMYADEGESRLIVFNRDAPLYSRANSLAMTAH